MKPLVVYRGPVGEGRSPAAVLREAVQVLRARRAWEGRHGGCGLRRNRQRIEDHLLELAAEMEKTRWRLDE